MLTVLFLVFSFVSGQFFDHNNAITNNENLDNVSYNPYIIRQKKFFPFFSVIRFANSQCLASNSLNGTCFTRRECNSYGGTPSGTCANGLGICCIFQKTCGSTTNINNTYFINPGYPTTYKGGERCTITINKCNSDICQVLTRIKLIFHVTVVICASLLKPYFYIRRYVQISQILVQPNLMQMERVILICFWYPDHLRWFHVYVEKILISMVHNYYLYNLKL